MIFLFGNTFKLVGNLKKYFANFIEPQE
jgi:hypothetical protein